MLGLRNEELWKVIDYMIMLVYFVFVESELCFGNYLDLKRNVEFVFVIVLNYENVRKDIVWVCYRIFWKCFMSVEWYD